eukprot:scaffold25855_cov82-Phaeocystis_antarctica.AAC.1
MHREHSEGQHHTGTLWMHTACTHWQRIAEQEAGGRRQEAGARFGEWFGERARAWQQSRELGWRGQPGRRGQPGILTPRAGQPTSGAVE